MLRHLTLPTVFVLSLYTSLVSSHAQTRESAVMHQATQVLDEIMAIPNKQIPESMLEDAHAVAVIPGVVKGSLVIGIRHGRGVLVTRDTGGAWRLPIFITLTGGSVGWQVGVQATDVILVFKSESSVAGLLRGKFTIGADAAAAAGPLGRQAAAATDAQLRAEILSYSRSRGLFAGISLDGSAIQTDLNANQSYYGSPLVGPDGSIVVPPNHIPTESQQLAQKIARYTGAPVVALTSDNAAVADKIPQSVQQEAERLRQELANASLNLYSILDESWQRFLAIPPQVHESGQLPDRQAMQVSLQRFDQVTGDPRYRGLSSRTEFQRVHQLARQFFEIQSWHRAKLNLPAPPTP